MRRNSKRHKPLPTWQELQAAERKQEEKILVEIGIDSRPRPLESAEMVFLDMSQFDGQANIKTVQQPLTPNESYKVSHDPVSGSPSVGRVSVFGTSDSEDKSGKDITVMMGSGMMDMGEKALADMTNMIGIPKEKEEEKHQITLKRRRGGYDIGVASGWAQKAVEYIDGKEVKTTDQRAKEFIDNIKPAPLKDLVDMDLVQEMVDFANRRTVAAVGYNRPQCNKLSDTNNKYIPINNPYDIRGHQFDSIQVNPNASPSVSIDKIVDEITKHCLK